jgi:DNA-binding MurR/RpiR family transcriptional regulator
MQPIDLNPNQVPLTKSELTLINYLYIHIDEIPFISITELAKRLSISSPTLSRAVRHLGFASFKDLKDFIAERYRISPSIKMEKVLEHSALPHTQLIHSEIEHLEETLKHWDKDAFSQAILAIQNANRVYFYGKGASAGLASIFAFRLNRFRKNTHIMEPSGSQVFESLHLVTKEDLVILFAFEKMPLEAQLIIEHQKKVGYQLLMITDRLYTYPSHQQSIQLYVSRGDSHSYHSMVTPIAMLDSLVVEYAKAAQPSTLKALDNLFELKETYAKQVPR